MYCCKCQNDLADCTCEDLAERLQAITQSPHIHVGAEYKERIQQQAQRNVEEKTVQE